MPKNPERHHAALVKRITALNAEIARDPVANAVLKEDVERLTTELRELTVKLNGLPRTVPCHRCDAMCSFDGGPELCWGLVIETPDRIHVCEGHAGDTYRLPGPADFVVMGPTDKVYRGG